MITLMDVYDAFLSKQLDDEWENWEMEEINEDWKTPLIGSIPWFKSPRTSLDFVTDDETGEVNFNEDLSNEEIQILATYMKCEWLNRTILTWENIKPLYEERDFSQANLLSKFNETLEEANFETEDYQDELDEDFDEEFYEEDVEDEDFED